MGSDLPDYTKYITPQTVISEPERPFGTKAETVTKYGAWAYAIALAVTDIPPAPAGQKVGIIMVVGSASEAGSYIRIETLQGGLWTEVVDVIHLGENIPCVLNFPCFKPTQDVSDGVNPTLRASVIGVSCASVCAVFLLYYYE